MSREDGLAAGPVAGARPLERVYLWPHVVLHQSRSCTLGRQEDQFRRLSVAVIVANENPVHLSFAKDPQRIYQAVLVSPRVLRSLLEAPDSDLTIVEIDIAHPVFPALRKRFPADGFAEFTPDEIRRLQALLRPGFLSPMSCDEVHQLFKGVLQVLGVDLDAAPVPRDRRIDRILELIQQKPFDEISTNTLAQAVAMSESRLRHLFKEQMDCSLSQYLRWANAWKALWQLRNGVSLSDAATALGFYDRAHLNRAINEQLFDPVSIFLKSRNLRVQVCGC